MSDGLPLTSLVDLLVSDGAVPLTVNDINFNVRFQAGYGTSSEGQIEDATNVIVTIQEFGRSFNGSRLLSEWEGSTIQVNITNSPYAAGSGATTMFGVGIVNINTSEINFQYRTADGSYANFNIQGILNHELVHVLTNLPDGLTHNEIVNIINSETGGGPYRSADYYDTIRPDDQCFLAGTQISMWDGTKKPIEQVEAGDIVVSYDKDGTLKPGRVKRTMTNRAKQILDVHGLMVTPGHATLCGDGRFNGQHVPILDILRSDGALVREDGTKIRAGTGCRLGTMGDRMITAIIGEQQPGGLVRIAEVGQIRAGTRFIREDGEDVSVLDMILNTGGRLTEDGMIQTSAGRSGIRMERSVLSACNPPVALAGAIRGDRSIAGRRSGSARCPAKATGGAWRGDPPPWLI